MPTEKPTKKSSKKPSAKADSKSGKSKSTEKNDAKEQFRQALERKNQGHADRVADARSGESVHGNPDTHQHGGKREFRRKSG
jgi:hypothetical protein